MYRYDSGVQILEVTHVHSYMMSDDDGAVPLDPDAVEEAMDEEEDEGGDIDTEEEAE